MQGFRILPFKHRVANHRIFWTRDIGLVISEVCFFPTRMGPKVTKYKMEL